MYSYVSQDMGMMWDVLTSFVKKNRAMSFMIATLKHKYMIHGCERRNNISEISLYRHIQTLILDYLQISVLICKRNLYHFKWVFETICYMVPFLSLMFIWPILLIYCF